VTYLVFEHSWDAIGHAFTFTDATLYVSFQLTPTCLLGGMVVRPVDSDYPCYLSPPFTADILKILTSPGFVLVNVHSGVPSPKESIITSHSSFARILEPFPVFIAAWFTRANRNLSVSTVSRPADERTKDIKLSGLDAMWHQA
jgi:hypothetical protein